MTKIILSNMDMGQLIKQEKQQAVGRTKAKKHGFMTVMKGHENML